MLKPYIPRNAHPNNYIHFMTLSIWGNIYFYSCLSYNDDIHKDSNRSLLSASKTLLQQKIPSINPTISKPSEVLGGDWKRIFPWFQEENRRKEKKKNLSWMNMQSLPVFQIAVNWSDRASWVDNCGRWETATFVKQILVRQKRSEMPDVIKIPVSLFQKMNLISIKLRSMISE